MKKFRFICIAVIFALVLNCTCFASVAENSSALLSAEWSVDYKNANDVILNVDIQSYAGYIQNISVVMYDDDFDALSEDNKPSFEDYYHMDEVVLKKGETASVKFGISDAETPLSDGAYRILVQGSGKDAKLSTLQFPVWVINPSKIPGIISRFNSADNSNTINCINEVKDTLKLDVKQSETTKRLSSFISIRKNDFNDKFSTLHDIEVAWKVSAVADSLAKTSPDKELIRELTEVVSSVLGVDTESDDYKKYTADVYTNMVYINSLSPADTIEEIKALFEKSLALASINEASSSEISSRLEKYYKALGIDEDVYEKYDECSDSQTKLKIQRLILKKGFKTADKIKETFEQAVEKYIKDSDSDSSSGSSGGSGGGGGGSKAGGAAGGFGAPVSSAVTDSGAKPSVSFKDCPDNHWAFSYIEELKSANILSGYSDGNFYPDKTVKREEFVKMIVLLSGIGNSEDTCSFDDVSSSDWYHTYVSSAYNAGIVNGVSDSRFGVGADISRQDVAVIVCRLLAKMGVSTDASTAKTFADSNEISAYATDSVNTLTAMSVLNGFEDGSFRPNASLTRAEASKIISLVKTYIVK